MSEKARKFKKIETVEHMCSFCGEVEEVDLLIYESPEEIALRAELEAVKAQRDKYRDVIDFIEENLVTYGTGYDIDNNEMGLEDKYGTCFSAYGANVFECVADARHTMKELEASES